MGSDTPKTASRRLILQPSIGATSTTTENGRRRCRVPAEIQPNAQKIPQKMHDIRPLRLLGLVAIASITVGAQTPNECPH